MIINSRVQSNSRLSPAAIQPKLEVGRPNDRFEQEADAVAEKVISGESQIQRKCAACEEEDKVQMKPLVQLKDTSSESGKQVQPWIQQQIESSRGGGQPLPDETRTFMESGIGADFQNVNIHTSGEAVQMNRELGAKAFTVGNDIYFNTGQYSPETGEGKRLLAHELTHTVQQGAASTSIQRDLATPDPGVELPQDDLTESEKAEAIRFNRRRYDERNTGMIQDIVGADVTGEWNEESVLAVAAVQEQFFFDKDGKVGIETFRFLTEELALEGAPTNTEDLLLLFQTPQGNVSPSIVRFGGQPFLQAHFRMNAQFSERSPCAEWEYRQYIKGDAWAQRPGSPKVNLNHFFNKLPAGQLTNSWEEDGNTDWAGTHYGHRSAPGRSFNPINRYEDHNGNHEQDTGCVYKGEDYPSVTDAQIQTGDDLELDIRFRGEIIRTVNGNRERVQQNYWTVRGIETV